MVKKEKKKSRLHGIEESREDLIVMVGQKLRKIRTE